MDLKSTKLSYAKKSHSVKGVGSIRKLLCDITTEEVMTKPRLTVSYVGNKTPKIVK